MTEDFDSLPIDRSYITEVFIKPDKTISLRVIGGPFRSASSITGEVCRIYEVEFERLGSFKVNVHAGPWLEVVSHSRLAVSEFLDCYSGRVESGVGAVFHYQIVCHEGTLDVLAGGFKCSLKEELPFVRRNREEAETRA